MELQFIQNKIYELRGNRVMLDFDLAEMYGVETKRLKEQVRRNMERFPDDFMFELSNEEWNNLKSQIATSSWGGSRYQPFAFTQEGVAMLSGVLRSGVAVQVNINIMRAFIAVRQYVLSNNNISKELEDIKKQIYVLQEDVKSLNKDHEFYEEQLNGIYSALTELASKPAVPKPNPIGYEAILDKNK
ncbi:MAG: ORF6N domain-containing protein [Prevotellaceae bacterium]|jgi:hypothetical protein|nr:ORF6N domain-containing protein [Prevotellaceae bacterium]